MSNIYIGDIISYQSETLVVLDIKEISCCNILKVNFIETYYVLRVLPLSILSGSDYISREEYNKAKRLDIPDTHKHLLIKQTDMPSFKFDKVEMYKISRL